MSDNGIAEITAEQAAAIIQNEKQRRGQAFWDEYQALCRKYGLALAARVTVAEDGRLVAVIDAVREIPT